jgi:hypothetical protein
MKHPLIIRNGKVVRRRTRVLPSLPYQGIARRALNLTVAYNTDIDVFAIIISK